MPGRFPALIRGFDKPLVRGIFGLLLVDTPGQRAKTEEVLVRAAFRRSVQGFLLSSGVS